MKSLYLSENFISDEGVTALMKGLNENNTLERLCLFRNDVTMNSNDLIIETMSGNTKLIHINVMENQLIMASVKKIQGFGVRNREFILQN